MSAAARFTILVLGGYGNFGRRIVCGLASRDGLRILVGGRHLERARTEVRRILATGPAAQLDAVCLDVQHAEWARLLDQQRVDLVIHTCGPFQGQDYGVARTCIQAGVHYIDLADSREFVLGFAPALDVLARRHGTLAVSGASSVPALAAAVVDHYGGEFKQLQAIRHSITVGNRLPRGQATTAAVLSYCGRAFPALRAGRWRQRYGWQGLSRHAYPAPVGRRWLAYCDVPDLSLFCDRYPGVEDVEFRAGLESHLLQLGLWSLSWLARGGLLRNPQRWAGLLYRLGQYWRWTGSDSSAMHVELQGIDRQGRPCARTWYLIGEHGDGPQVPATAAVVVAKKLAAGTLPVARAQACMGLFELPEFMAELSAYAIRTVSYPH